MFKPRSMRPCSSPTQAFLATLASCLVAWFVCLMSGATVSAQQVGAGTGSIKVLFLGDQGHHRPADLYRVLGPSLKSYGIEVTYSEDVATSLSTKRLAEFDALMIYANIDQLGAEQEKSDARLCRFWAWDHPAALRIVLLSQLQGLRRARRRTVQGAWRRAILDPDRRASTSNHEGLRGL